MNIYRQPNSSQGISVMQYIGTNMNIKLTAHANLLQIEFHIAIYFKMCPTDTHTHARTCACTHTHKEVTDSQGKELAFRNIL